MRRRSSPASWIHWNSCSNAKERQQLKQFIPKLIGTAANNAVELRRSWMALDWTVRVLDPAWLRLAEFDVEAGRAGSVGRDRGAS
jgi:hypothetical protein